MPKDDPIREQQARILIKGFEKEMGRPVPLSQQKIFVPQFAKGTITMYEFQQITKAVAADPILKASTFSINRLFHYNVALLTKNSVMHEIKRIARKSEDYGVSSLDRVMMTKGLAKLCHGDPGLMREAIVIAMDRSKVVIDEDRDYFGEEIAKWNQQTVSTFG